MRKTGLVRFFKKNIVNFLPFFLVVFSYCYELKTVYGSCTVDEPVLLELFECPAMQRLKEIHQYGISYCLGAYKPYSRYEHSLGVFYLVKKFGGSLHEQIAALLHDVSHTVFSHVGDHVFKHFSEKSSYQDSIHTWFIERTEIPKILSWYDITLEDIHHKKGGFPLLEKDLPDLCADRIEYILYGGLIENQLSKEDIAFIVDSLDFKDGVWFFHNEQAALKLAETSLYLTEHTFGSAWNFVVYDWAAQALTRAVEINLLTLDDIHFSTDAYVWSALCESNDAVIEDLVKCLQNPFDNFIVETKDSFYDSATFPKCRAVDPYIKVQENLVRLSVLNQAYAQNLNDLKNTLKKGIFVKFNKKENF